MSVSTYWHIAETNAQGQPTLGHGDGRIIVAGETLTVEGDPKLCASGLHACARLLDCLQYCRGAAIQEVTLGPDAIQEGDKSVASSRTCIRILPAAEGERILRGFARWCALDVAHLWEMPAIVQQYLKTGDESLRAAARAATWDAARAAEWDAAEAAAWAATWDAARAAAEAAARDAAEAAARDATWAAAEAAARDAAEAAARDATWAAARAAAWDAARAAARDRYNANLVERVEAAFAVQEPAP